jgi:hypothetical protein
MQFLSSTVFTSQGKLVPGAATPPSLLAGCALGVLAMLGALGVFGALGVLGCIPASAAGSDVAEAGAAPTGALIVPVSVSGVQAITPRHKTPIAYLR